MTELQGWGVFLPTTKRDSKKTVKLPGMVKRQKEGLQDT